MAEYKQPVLVLRQAFVEQIGDGLAGQEAALALEDYLERLEASMATIAARRSRIFWVHLSRRIPPIPQEGASAWTTLLYRTIFALALVKHGHPDDGTDDFRLDDESGTLAPQTLLYDDCRDIYNLEYLALEYNAAATANRRVCKGAILKATGRHGFDTEAAPECERLMRLVDQRVARYYGLFSPYGSSLDPSPALLRGNPNLAREALLYAALNAEQRSLPREIERRLATTIGGRTNYMPAVLAMAPIRALLSLFETQVVVDTGATPWQILAFLSAVGMRELVTFAREQPRAVQFLQRAYWLTEEGDALDQVLEEVAQIYATIINDSGEVTPLDAARREVRDIFSGLIYTEAELRQLRLADKMPHKLILRHGAYLLWDYSNIVAFLQSLMSSISALSGDVGNTRADNFEAEVVAQITATEGVDLWEADRVLVAPDGTERQIDASFIKGNVLYVVECKSYRANRRVARGEWSALNDRWKTLHEYFTQAQTLCAFIADNPQGRGGSYRVPAQVTRIEPCLCTPLPEYIPDTADEYWFDDETPRICTPQELLEFATGTKPRLLMNGDNTDYSNAI